MFWSSSSAVFCPYDKIGKIHDVCTKPQRRKKKQLYKALWYISTWRWNFPDLSLCYDWSQNPTKNVLFDAKWRQECDYLTSQSMPRSFLDAILKRKKVRESFCKQLEESTFTIHKVSPTDAVCRHSLDFQIISTPMNCTEPCLVSTALHV